MTHAGPELAWENVSSQVPSQCIWGIFLPPPIYLSHTGTDFCMEVNLVMHWAKGNSDAGPGQRPNSVQQPSDLLEKVFDLLGYM